MGNSDNSTQEKILDATENLIIAKGIEKTSLADIAKEVGISKGTLYYHYSSKDQLIEDVADRYFNNMTQSVLEGIKDLNHGTYDFNTLSSMISDILGYRSTGRLHLSLIQEAVTRNETLRCRFIEKYSQWRGIIKYELKNLLKVESVDYEMLSFLVVAVIDGLVMESLLGLNEENIDSISKFIVKALKMETNDK